MICPPSVFTSFRCGSHQEISRSQLEARVTYRSLIHLWIMPFMLRLHPAGYAQHERTSHPARPERSAAKSKGEQAVFTTHLKKDPYRSLSCALFLPVLSSIRMKASLGLYGSRCSPII